jgi:CRP-like cAMP-binding protein
MSSTLRAVNRLQTLAPGCPDCPAVLSNRLTGMVEGPEASPGCMFRAVRIGEREMLPLQWSENCEFALVRRGVVARQFADAGGAAATIDLAGPGSLFRLVQDRESSIASYALSDAVLCLCTPDAFRSALREDSTNATDMIALQAMALDRVERLSAARGRRTVKGRVAALLCAIADSLTPYRRLNLIPSSIHQRDMGALLAVRHESVCRSMTTMQRQGILAREPEGIRIVDRAALEATA